MKSSHPAKKVVYISPVEYTSYQAPVHWGQATPAKASSAGIAPQARLTGP